MLLLLLTCKRQLCINRIRLEFKDDEMEAWPGDQGLVLIESDWNLKPSNSIFIIIKTLPVLIESDWNLKVHSFSPLYEPY